MSYPLRLVGDRVVLREFGADDLDAVYAMVGDDRVTRSLSVQQPLPGAGLSHVDRNLGPGVGRPSS